ncbi:hypothetical protein LCGC14_2277480 [marine sediment metagenome]|uniref:Uncharacterized protein n=1 Tax=marine sediment metagenome TaxID=412755 RepID=A0A0F9FQ96_9ZZZZ
MLSRGIANRQTFVKWYSEIPEARPGHQMVGIILDWLSAFWECYSDHGCPAGLTSDHECSHRFARDVVDNPGIRDTLTP